MQRSVPQTGVCSSTTRWRRCTGQRMLQEHMVQNVLCVACLRAMGRACSQRTGLLACVVGYVACPIGNGVASSILLPNCPLACGTAPSCEPYRPATARAREKKEECNVQKSFFLSISIPQMCGRKAYGTMPREWLLLLEDRVGDYVHCLARLTNTFWSRLIADVPEGQLQQALRRTRDDIIAQGRQQGPRQLAAPRSPLVMRTLDLSCSLFFLRTEDRQGVHHFKRQDHGGIHMCNDVGMHGWGLVFRSSGVGMHWRGWCCTQCLNLAAHHRVLAIVQQSAKPPVLLRGRRLALHGAITLLLRHMRDLHLMWSQTDLLLESGLANHLATVTGIGALWDALGWAPTPWLHWTASGHLRTTEERQPRNRACKGFGTHD